MSTTAHMAATKTRTVAIGILMRENLLPAEGVANGIGIVVRLGDIHKTKAGSGKLTS
ncbi:MAG TPA: hypothetical protein VD771_05640 [Gemmatimonadaceae bacterium]|nr:hypothetical protein [Gemmatimonadaceae bacterium]